MKRYLSNNNDSFQNALYIKAITSILLITLKNTSAFKFSNLKKSLLWILIYKL